MKKSVKYLLSPMLLFLNFGICGQANFNFKVTNKTGQPLYIIVGSKKLAPENKPESDKQLIPATGTNTFSTNVNLKEYPEFILFTDDLRRKSQAFSVEIIPSSGTENIFIDASLKKTFLGSELVVAPSQQEVGWVRKSYKPLPGNINANQIQTSQIAYKPAKVITDPYQFLTSHYNAILNYTTTSSGKLSAQSSPLELLGFKAGSKQSQNAINARYEEIKKSIEYLKKQPDQKSLYDKLIIILENAKNKL